MKLESFKEKNTKRKAIIVGSVFVVLLISVIVLIRSFALFETKQEYNVIKGSVGNYSPSDITITSYIDGSPNKTFPNKDSEYRVDKVECSNGARGLWNYTNWEVNLSNLTTTGTKCKVYFVKSYKEAILNGTDPIISENLIPITIENDGTVKKADMTSEWYKYENKMWANAVILEDESIVYQNGEVIPENNIESYFVWIPRYKYKIFNEGKYSEVSNATYQNNAKEIEIVFENKNTSVSNGSTIGSYLSHPAFTSFNSNGMWVGKFETGYKGSKNTIEAQVNVNDSSKVQIKPNSYSWRGIQLSNVHLNSYNYQRTLDSHAMKNTEWGAVAYLSHSKYGSQMSIRINNNSSRITGFSAVLEPTCGYTETNESCNIYGNSYDINVGWNSVIGAMASTTNNLSGIYDMAGGSLETMMSFSKINDYFNVGIISIPSGFNGIYSDTKELEINGIAIPNSKYYDLYQNHIQENHFENRILGDATGEMGPFTYYNYVSSTKRKLTAWYEDEGWFIVESSPFFSRGGFYNGGVGSSIFYFHYTNAQSNGNTYRIVLTP